MCGIAVPHLFFHLALLLPFLLCRSSEMSSSATHQLIYQTRDSSSEETTVEPSVHTSWFWSALIRRRLSLRQCSLGRCGLVGSRSRPSQALRFANCVASWLPNQTLPPSCFPRSLCSLACHRYRFSHLLVFLIPYFCHTVLPLIYPGRVEYPQGQACRAEPLHDNVPNLPFHASGARTHSN